MKKFYLLICTTIILILLSITGCQVTESSYSEKELPNNEFFMTVLEYGTEQKPSVAEFFSSSDCLSRLKNMNQSLNSEFDFTELCFQPVYYVGQYNGDTKFVSSYEHSKGETINMEVPLTNGNKICVTDLKALQLGKTCYKNFEKQLYKGNNFKEENYHVASPTQNIPVILGYDYLDYYDLGDKLSLSLHEKNLIFEVIGFYQKNTSFQFETSNILLDQCIVMPFYDIKYTPTDTNDEVYQKIYYTQKNEGYIQVPININTNDYRTTCYKLLTQLASKNNLLFTLPLSTTKIAFETK